MNKIRFAEQGYILLFSPVGISSQPRQLDTSNAYEMSTVETRTKPWAAFCIDTDLMSAMGIAFQLKFQAWLFFFIRSRALVKPLSKWYEGETPVKPVGIRPSTFSLTKEALDQLNRNDLAMLDA